MNGFEHITTIVVPASLVEETNSQLRLIGRRGMEGFALWAGVPSETKFLVRSHIIPQQTGHLLEGGVCVSVGPEELHRINVSLFENQMTLIAQIHTHPTDAYHSETDDAYPIATTVGSVSIVIPYFARQPFALSRCAVYRLCPQRGWVDLTPQEASRLIHIVEQ
jgi:hypothetical protein